MSNSLAADAMLDVVRYWFPHVLIITPCSGKPLAANWNVTIVPVIPQNIHAHVHRPLFSRHGLVCAYILVLILMNEIMDVSLCVYEIVRIYILC